MIKYISVIGCCALGVSHANAADMLVWPQSEAFYNGQVEQKYHSIDSSSISSLGVKTPPSPSIGYVPSDSQGNPYYSQNYAQNSNYYPNNRWGSYFPNMINPYGGYFQPNYYAPANNFMNGMNNVMPMGNFSPPNPMNGLGFQSIPFVGNNMFNPFGR